MTQARERMLATLRDGLRGADVPALPPPWRGATIAAAERVARFTAVLTKIGGRVDRVADLTAAAARVREILAAAGARRVAVSDAAELAPLTGALSTDVTVLPAAAAREDLLTADAGVTSAQWGIAETGTLVLMSSRERNRLASLLPGLHVAVLPCSRLVGSLGDALAAVRATDGAPGARTVTFVTGPSRTADIELTLVVGVHGPKALHVVLVDGV